LRDEVGAMRLGGDRHHGLDFLGKRPGGDDHRAAKTVADEHHIVDSLTGQKFHPQQRVQDAGFQMAGESIAHAESRHAPALQPVTGLGVKAFGRTIQTASRAAHPDRAAANQPAMTQHRMVAGHDMAVVCLQGQGLHIVGAIRRLIIAS